MTNSTNELYLSTFNQLTPTNSKVKSATFRVESRKLVRNLLSVAGVEHVFFRDGRDLSLVLLITPFLRSHKVIEAVSLLGPLGRSDRLSQRLLVLFFVASCHVVNRSQTQLLLDQVQVSEVHLLIHFVQRLRLNLILLESEKSDGNSGIDDG